MGQKLSVPDLASMQKLPADSVRDAGVFSLSFRSRSQIYLVGCPHDLVIKLEQVIAKHYKDGCRSTSAWAGAHVFALHGRPFAAKLNKVHCRHIMQLMCALIAAIQANGWQFVANVDVCYWNTPRTMLFRRIKYSRYHAECTYDNTLAVNIRCSGREQQSKLDVINAQHVDIVPVVREAIGDNAVVKQTSIDGSEQDVTFSIHGHVWKAEETHLFGYKSAMRGRSVLLELFRKLDSIGYHLIAAATATGCGDSLFFQKSSSAAAPPAHSAGPRFALLSVNKSDRMRLLGVTSEVSQAVFAVAQTHWTKGLHGDRPRHDREFYCDEIRFEGSPWECKDDEETRQARLVLLRVFEELSRLGWGVETGINITPWSLDDASVMVLRSCDKAKRAHFCIHPMAGDQLWVIGAERAVIDAIQLCINTHAPDVGTVLADSDETNATCVFKFETTGPWTEHYWVQARHLLAQLVAALDKIGWRLAFSADCSIVTSRQKHGDVEHTTEMDTLFFLKN